MKKVLLMILSCLMVISLTACNNSNEGLLELDGGWQVPKSMKITDKEKELLNKATEELTGASYKPVAYVASQVVNGTNHLLLCTVSVIGTDAEARYALVYLYEDTEGKVEMTQVLTSNATASESGLLGGWSKPENKTITEELQKVFDKAVENITGVEYTAIAYLANQIVAGANYCILCQAKDVGQDTEARYVIMDIYEDPEHNAEITGVYDFAAE
ncbi:MAG: hypothetical protein IJJ19_02865 [Erysipelotrichaceae bacterium]|nr:hypothetical protein [Erysipelotrichaceae bacterium]